MPKSLPQKLTEKGLSLFLGALLTGLILPAHAQDYYGSYGNNQNQGYGANTYNNPNQGYNYGGNQNLPPLQGSVATAPAGSFLSTSFSAPVSSQYARPGDRLQATLGNDLAAGGQIILPAGSRLEAQIVSATPAGRAGKNGQLDIRFTNAILPNGQRVALSARIQTEDGTGILKGGTGKGRLGKAAVKTGVGAGLGALAGTALGPLAGGKVGRGAIYGTAVGASAGALTAAWQKGKEAEIPAGQPINVVLDQPLTLGGAVNSNYGNSYNQPNNSNYNYSPPPNQYNANPYGQATNQYPSTNYNY